MNIDPKEQARLTAELRRTLEEDRKSERKKNRASIFTAILVVTGVVAIGSFLYGFLPAPFNVIALLLLAAAWLYFYEN